MTAFRFAALATLAVAAAACTQQEPAPAAPPPAPETRTIVETREVAVPVPANPPTVVIERRDDRPADSTTVRAGENGIEVETTRRN
ncbi:MAG: hypothetical protein ACXW3K_10740 [Brevundimonas sp.]